MIAVSHSISTHQHIWHTIQGVIRDRRKPRSQILLEDLSFYVYRTDTNAILARGIVGYEAAKERANQIRKQQGLTWNLVKFKAERRTQVPSEKKIRFGVSPDGKTFTNAYGQRSRVDYSRNFNPSKGRRFRGYTDAQGNYHDID